MGCSLYKRQKDDKKRQKGLQRWESLPVALKSAWGRFGWLIATVSGLATGPGTAREASRHDWLLLPRHSSGVAVLELRERFLDLSEDQQRERNALCRVLGDGLAGLSTRSQVRGSLVQAVLISSLEIKDSD